MAGRGHEWDAGRRCEHCGCAEWWPIAEAPCPNAPIVASRDAAAAAVQRRRERERETRGGES